MNAVWSEMFQHDPAEIGKTYIFPRGDVDFNVEAIIKQLLKTKHKISQTIELDELNQAAPCQFIFEPIVENGQIASILVIAAEDDREISFKQKTKSPEEDRTNKLQAVFDVIAVASEAHEKELETVLQGCLEQVIDSTYASGGAIQLLDDDSELLYLQAHAGLEPKIVSEMQKSSAESGLFGWTASHQEKLVLPDLTNDWRSSEVIRDSDVNVYAGVPMNVEGEVIGVFSLFRERKRTFRSDDIAMLTSVANQIGVIITNHRLRSENERLLLIEERNRLARELHDAVTQSLYSSVLMTEALQKQAELSHLENVQAISKQLQANAHQALKEMRLLIHNLRPPILSSVGLARAINHRLKAVEERAGVDGHLIVNGKIAVPNAVEETLYFVISEALNNTLKHSQAKKVEVHLRQTAEKLQISIKDNGCGFDVDRVEEGGLGLVSMQERMHQIKGDIEISSEVGLGTKILLTWEENDD